MTVTVTVEGATYPVTFKGLFNRTTKGIRQQEPDTSPHQGHEHVGNGEYVKTDPVHYQNGPEQAALFDGLGQELADLVSELHAAKGSEVLDTLAEASKRIVTFGASNPGPTAKFRADMAAIDPRLGDLVDRYGAAWKQAADMGSPKLFQEDLADITRTIRERSMGTAISDAEGQAKAV